MRIIVAAPTSFEQISGRGALKMSDTVSKKPDRRLERQQRLEAELRANLQKRKALVRARSQDPKKGTPDQTGPSED